MGTVTLTSALILLVVLVDVTYCDSRCAYDFIGNSKGCSSHVYTKIKGQCDGWPNTSQDDCQRKCDNNEAPSGCASQPCSYAIWDDNKDWQPGWCQLATSSCTIASAGSKHKLFKKIPSFEYKGHGKSCHSDVYTSINGKCDGWSRTGLEECKRKCQRNEAPSGCASKPCKFVIWDDNSDWSPGWCQLATEGCKIGAAGAKHVVYEKVC